MKLLVLLAITLHAACAADHTRQAAAGAEARNADREAHVGGQPAPPTPSPAKSGIRAIDFNNFTYDWYPDWGEVSAKGKKIVLGGGEMEVDVPSGVNAPVRFALADVKYGDLTGDGDEEAAVTVGIWSRGTARHHCVFVYTMSHDAPKLLWTNETGDRAHWGYRQSSVEDGQLIIDRYKPDTIPMDGKEVTLESSSKFVRDYYKWAGGGFQKIRTQEFTNTPEDRKPWVVSRTS